MSNVNRHRGVLEGHTGQFLTFANQGPVYAATLATTYIEHETIVKVGVLTGPITINSTIADLKIGDKVKYLFEADASIRIVTFGTGHVPDGTQTIAATKKGSADFIYDGVDLVEASRFIQP